jgi:membrane protease YdiL (CAAX protease family)
MDRKTLLLLTILVEGGLFALGWLLLGGTRAPIWLKFGASWGATASGLLSCIPLLSALYLVDRSDWAPISRLRRLMDEQVRPIFANCKGVDLALIALVAGVGEELFFRGWLQTVLVTRFDVWVGILAASLIFGLSHYLSTGYAVYAFLTGIYLGVIFQASENLYIAMLIHALYDFIAMVYLVHKGSGREDELTTVE